MEQQMEVKQEVQQELALPANYVRKLTAEQTKQVSAMMETIDVHDKGKIAAYGREQQAVIGQFYDSVLQGVGTSEVGEAGNLLAQVIGNINGYNDECNKGDKSGLFSFFRKQKNKLDVLQAKYKTVAENMDAVVEELKQKDLALGQVSRSFDAMYETNLATYDFLTMVIFAGEQKLKEEKRKYAKLQQAAQESGDLMEMQKVSDFGDDITRFERRLYDLKLSRTVAMQQAPQIRNIQKSADELSESIRTTMVTSIALWKSQMAMALGMQVVQQGLDAVNAVRNATNAMLIANSQQNMHLATETAKAVERGAVDIETISTVNQNLIDSLKISFDIAKGASERREEGARQLQAKEAELKSAIEQYAQ